MDAPLGDEDDLSLIDTIISDDYSSADENVSRKYDNAEIYRLMLILTDKEREIINLYFGLNVNHSYTLEEIAYRMDLTRERVRQLKDKAIKKLKQSPNKNLLKMYLEQ